ncbi:MAG: hypothetical protein Q8P67_04440, partial [archaeon]|nr:hypothetical protein [archaeon]
MRPQQRIRQLYQRHPICKLTKQTPTPISTATRTSTPNFYCQSPSYPRHQCFVPLRRHQRRNADAHSPSPHH